MQSRSPNREIRCKACGKPADSGQFCRYCQEMREELRCWPIFKDIVIEKRSKLRAATSP